MVEPARKRATYADVLAAPEHLVAEIIGGRLVTSPRPAPRHSQAASVVGAAILGPFHLGAGGPGGWWILDEPELHLLDGSEIVVPDLGGWRVERLAELPKVAYFETAPDWVCEVLSPSTEALDRADKMPIYAKAGVQHVWLVDPLVQTLEVLRLEQGRWLLLSTFKGEQAVRAEPFASIDLPLGPVWKHKA